MSSRAWATLIIAVFVLPVFAVPAAGVQAAEFTSSAAETTITATPDGVGTSSHHVIDFAGASITCSGVALHGVQLGTAVTALRLTNTYEGCTFLGANVLLPMRGCEYELSANGSMFIVSQVGRNCATEPIAFEAPGCKVTIGPQGPLTGVTYTNIKPGTSEEITVALAITGIKYTASGIFCPSGSGTFTNGNYTTGNTILTCSPVGEPTKTVNCKRDA